ncbi:MAG: hypothetical protein KBB39_00865 [Phycicoccus sp.]|nr:hypothetical protein [Phycicoccus sp.]
MIDVLTTVLVVVVLLFAAGWYLSYSAARLDRLHAKAEGSLSALDAQLVRRAEAGLELATSGSLDPASALLVADAATTALERHTTHPLGDDPLDGQHFGGLESVESDLTAALMAALTTESVATIREDQPESAGVEALDRLEAAALRVQMARRFHNQAVREVRRVRAKRVVRVFHLAGHAALPEPVEFDDALPAA